MDINGITAVVSGGAKGLGRAVTDALLARGAQVAIIDLGDLPTDLRGNSKVHHAQADVTDEAAIIAALNEIATVFGSIEVCVNCAGIFHSAPTLAADGEVHPLADFRRVLEVNVNGTFAVLSQAARHMARNPGQGPERERGVIVNVASIRAFDGGAGGMAYAASKGAIHAMTLSLARDLAPYGIRANTVAPGTMNTEMFHKLSPEAIADHTSKTEFPKRLGHPSEFAHAVCFMIENGYMNGETLRIDAGMRV